MANRGHMDVLREGIEVLKAYSEENSGIIPDLSVVDLSNLDLSGVDLRQADLSWSDLHNTSLEYAHLHNTKLQDSKLSGDHIGPRTLMVRR
jgi:uncharacterized protein YjbI with pentapeptide repeats